MTTFVGNQKDFGDAVKELIELEYDAVEAYKLAVEKLEAEEYRSKIKEFKKDHERHIDELLQLLKTRFHKAPDGPTAKSWLTKGKTYMASLISDDTILRAMKSNEIDTNTAYERMTERGGQWDDAKDVLTRGLTDEKRHKAWLDSVVK